MRSVAASDSLRRNYNQYAPWLRLAACASYALTRLIYRLDTEGAKIDEKIGGKELDAE